MQPDYVDYIDLSGDIKILYVDNQQEYIPGDGILKEFYKKSLYKT